jgi:hypothetical protein
MRILERTDDNVMSDSKLIPENTRIEGVDKEVSLLIRATVASRAIKIYRLSIASRKDIYFTSKRDGVECLLRAPVEDNACKPNLLRVIGDIGSKAKNCAAKMPIRALDDFWYSHVRLERSKNHL